MNRADQLRASIEAKLSKRIPAALTPQIKATLPVISTGVAELDDMLGGGFPVGAITEIVGGQSSGRTSCAQSFVARVLAQGKVGAWIDVSNALHPESAAANGIELSRLLWVRCGGSDGQPGSSEGLRPGRPTATQKTKPASSATYGSGSLHPRNEVHGISQALGPLFSGAPASGRSAPPPHMPSPRRDSRTGTPGMPNRDLRQAAGPRSMHREEQVSSDRMPPRRGDYLLAERARHSAAAIPPKRSERAQNRGPQQMAFAASAPPRKTDNSELPRLPGTQTEAQMSSSPWNQLDKGLRTMDLVLQTGGFGVVVFDLGSMTPEMVDRIPMATWFRFRVAAERTQAAVVLITQHFCTQSSAEVVLRTHLEWPTEATPMLSGFRCTAELVRQRSRPPMYTDDSLPPRKPPQRVQSVTWTLRPPWSRGQ